MSSAVAEHIDLKEAPPAGDSENTEAQFASIVQPEEAAVTIGEEDVILDLKVKLYRNDKESNEWKEAGAGTLQFLKHKKTGQVRLVMRQSKSLWICANHLVLPNMTVKEHASNEKSCVWRATDFADGEVKAKLFCGRFASIEHNKLFMEKFEEVAESQSPEEESKQATEAAELIAKLNIGENYEAEEPATTKKRKQKKRHLPPRKRTKKTTSRVMEKTKSRVMVLSNFFGPHHHKSGTIKSRVMVVLSGCFGRPHQKSGLDLQVTLED